VITACGDGMTFAYTTAYNATSSGYMVNGVDLSNIPSGCRNKTLSATFYDHSGTTVGSAVAARLAGSGTSQSIAVAPSSNAIEAGEVDGVSVVVS